MRLFFSLLILLSFFSRATEPVQVFTDDLGRKVTVPAHPKRIVSLHDLDITIPLIELGVPPVASHGRTRPDGDEGGPVAGQEGDGISDVLRAAGAVEGDVFQEKIQETFGMLT